MRLLSLLLLVTSLSLPASAQWDTSMDDRTLVGKPFNAVRIVLPEATQTVTDPKLMPMTRKSKGLTMYVYQPVRLLPPSSGYYVDKVARDCQMQIVVNPAGTILMVTKTGPACDFSLKQTANVR